MNSISLDALCNGKSSANCVSVVEARSACQVVQEENQGQERTTRSVQFAGSLDTHVLKNISSTDNFNAGKVRKDGMGHPGLLFQVSKDGSASETRNSSIGSNLESTKYVDSKCADRNKSTSDEKLTPASNGGEIHDDAYCKVKNENISNNSWFRTWPERGPDKFIYCSGKSTKNSTSDCRLNGVPDERKQEWHGRITQDNGAGISEKVNKSNFANPRKGNNSRACSAEFNTQHSLSPRADGCAVAENVDASLASSNCKCISTPISLTKLLESMPSLAYNPVTKGLQLAVTEREAKGDRENDIPICKPAIPDDEEDDLCERVAPPWAQHHPGCLRNGRLEIIEEEDEEERRKGNRQRTVEDPPDLFPSLPARPLPSTSSSSASLSSVSSLSTGTGGCTTDEGCHGEGPFGAPCHHSKAGENRRSGITGFFSSVGEFEEPQSLRLRRKNERMLRNPDENVRTNGYYSDFIRESYDPIPVEINSKLSLLGSKRKHFKESVKHSFNGGHILHVGASFQTAAMELFGKCCHNYIVLVLLYKKCPRANATAFRLIFR
ncbi:hypothetical protein J437_LFUL016175, partial [Ladona fulva]